MTAEAGPTCGAIDCENHRPNTHPYGRREAMRRTVRQMLTTDRDPDEVLRLVMLIRQPAGGDTMTDEPECMTCNGATTYDLATRQLFFGSIPLCFLHAELMRETIADAEWPERVLGP